MTEALKQIWDKVDRMMGPQRMETEAEHIARDMREGRFPERSDPIQVPVNPKPEAKTDLITAEDARKLLDEGAKGYIAAYPPSLVVDLARTVIALHAQLSDAQAAMALVVERAVAICESHRDKSGADIAHHNAAQGLADAIRALAPIDGLALVRELREEIASSNKLLTDEARASLDRLERAETAEADRDRLAAANAVLEAKVAGLVGDQRFYIDCEFDGHNGPLLSIAMVREDGWGLHVEVAGVVVEDPWVLENIVPILAAHEAPLSCRVRPNEVGRQLRHFIGDCHRPTIIADSPVDIGRFCRAISTGEDGGWASTVYPGMTFEVRNVDCYPTTLEGAVQHNAWWDAMALRAALATQEAGT